MKRIGDDLLLDSLKQQEDYVQGATNAIDVKASQTIAAAAFLAVQPAVLLLASNVPLAAVIIQVLGYIAISAAIYKSHLALEIQNYPSPGFSEDWCLEVIGRMPNAPDSDVRDSMMWALAKLAAGRIEEARKLNDDRLTDLKTARTAINWALGCNVLAFLVTVIVRIFSR